MSLQISILPTLKLYAKRFTNNVQVYLDSVIPSKFIILYFERKLKHPFPNILKKNIVSQLVYHIDIGFVQDCSFLNAKPWIPGGEISIFTAVIH